MSRDEWQLAWKALDQGRRPAMAARILVLEPLERRTAHSAVAALDIAAARRYFPGLTREGSRE